MIHKITTLLETPEQDFIYQTIRRLPLQLCADVGAAAGEKSRTIRLAGDDMTRVVAFEPFPANHGFFQAAVRDLDNVELVTKAVSDKTGHADFFVSSTVSGTEPGWERFAGYSSVGLIPRTTGDWLKQVVKLMIAPLRGMKDAHRIRVETTTLDKEFPTEHVDFLKVDVQGAESRVLLGAERLLEEGRIGLMYLEWSGDRLVEEILSCHGYEIYDSNYVAFSPDDDPGPFTRQKFEILGRINLSTGRKAFDMVYRGDSTELGAVLRGLNTPGGTWAQTDLIAVKSADAARFAQLVGEMD